MSALHERLYGGFGKDKYEKLDCLGKGGHSEVYRARQRGTNRLVALKILLGSDNPERCLSEVELLARFHHSNIVQIYEAGYWDAEGELYIAMQLVDGGGTLATKLEEERLRDPLVGARLMARIARTIHFAHQHNVLHLDLKPSNILIDALGVPFVADFGVAEPLGGEVSSQLAGTLPYMAPEQCQNQPRKCWTDVYALGTMLYQLATGRTPYDPKLTLDERVALFEARQLPAAASQVAAEHHWALGRRLDRDFDHICEGALAIQASERYPSANALADDLDRWVLGLPICGPKRMRPPVVQSMLRFTRRNLSALVISALAFCSFIAGSVVVQLDTEQYLEDWILRSDKLLVDLQAQILRRGMREFRDLIAKLGQGEVVKQALARPEQTRCEASSGPELTETQEWHDAMSQGMWKDGPDQAYVSDTQGCFYQYWPAPGPRSVYRHWYGFRDYFECGYRLGMAHSKDTCIARVFRSEYDWYDNTLRLAFATPVYDAQDNWIGVFVASWRAERPLADIALGPMPALRSNTALLVPRDLDRPGAEGQLEAAKRAEPGAVDYPKCSCEPSSSPPVPPDKFLKHLVRPTKLSIAPRTATREEMILSDDTAAVIAASVLDGTRLVRNFRDPRDDQEYLAAFASLQDAPASGTEKLTPDKLAPLLMVATERAVLTRYTRGINAMGILLLLAGALLLGRYISILVRGDDERLRSLRGE